MKHIYFTLFLLCATTLTHAAFIDTIQIKKHTISELSTLKNGDEIILEGQIQKHLHKDKYQFSDSTGQIIVEIKSNRWGDLDVTQNDTVRLTGKLEHDFEGTSMKVNRISLVK